MVEMDNKQVTPEVVKSIGAFLEPGDIIATRHAKALTNLFPGFWPHGDVRRYAGTAMPWDWPSTRRRSSAGAMMSVSWRPRKMACCYGRYMKP